MFREKVKGFLAGVCATVLLAGAATAFAASIDVVMGGIKVYWDGIEKTLTDVNGNKVEPMIYEGTTYVPLRAMASLMGKEVDWDQQNMAVIVGEQPAAKSTPLSEMEDKINPSGTVLDLSTKKVATLRLKNETYEVENVLPGNYGRGLITYVLENKYTRFVGKAVHPYSEVGSNSSAKLEFYSVSNSGEETLIREYEFKQAEEAIDIDVNLTGVINLRIVLQSTNDDYAPMVYDAYFLSE